MEEKCFEDYVTLGELPTSYLISMSYEEGICALINEINEVLIDIEKAINDLKEYIDEKIDEIVIPTKLSELDNDTGFITNTVSDLVNYYNKTYIDNLIGDINSALDTINGEVI